MSSILNRMRERNMKRFTLIGMALMAGLWLFGLLTPGADAVNTALPSQLQQPGGLFGIGGSDQVLEVKGQPALYEDHRYLVDLETIHDGDTVRVIYGGKSMRIRLLGIDAPELDQPRGDDSRRYLDSLTDDDTVYIEPAGYDRFGRMLAVLWASHRSKASVNEHMVWGGMAYTFMTEDATLLNAQADAMVAQRGVWGDEKPVQPADWRAAQRLNAAAESEQ